MATIYTSKTKEELPERAAHDHYRTEQTLVDAAVRYFYRTYLERMGVCKERILDPCAGDGRWGIALARAAVRYEMLIGVDIDRKWGMDINNADYWYYDWHTGDFIDPTIIKDQKPFNVILSNPPYGPNVKGRKKLKQIFDDHGWELHPKVRAVTTSELFIRRAWDILAPTGYMMYLMPMQMMSSEDRYQGLWRTHAPIDVRICSRRPSFYGGGTNGTDYALYIWHKRENGLNANLMGHEWKCGLLLYDRSDEK